MATAQKLSCFLITGYILQISGILVALLTDHWAGEDEFHFGVLKYCVDNTSICQEVTDKLHFIEAYLYASRYSLIGSCVVGFFGLILSILSLCECYKIGRKPKTHARIHVTGTLLMSTLDTSAVITFAFGSSQLTESYQMGWSFFVAVSMAIFTGLTFVVLLTSTLYCNKACYVDTSSVGDSQGTALIFTEPPTNVSVRIGQTISVHASVLNAKYVRWFKGRDHVISISTSFQEEFKSPKASLTLTNARPQDDGEYTCVAETFGRNKQEIRQTFSIFVLRARPVFKECPNDVTVYLGSALCLEAIVENAETVTWLHDGTTLSNSKNKIIMKFLHACGRASLRIQGVKKDNEGNYTCCAKSGVDPLRTMEESVHCHVKIKDGELPSFANVPKSVKVKVHTPLEIAIKVHGFPLPEQVSWFKDGQPLSKSREISLQYLDGNSTLIIHDTGPLNSGLYECHAENKHGNNTCRIPVQIFKEEQEVLQCVICLNSRPTRVLQCGHAFCSDCTNNLSDCAICRTPIRSHTPLYL
uniref:Striated muscle-specific serine/threonine-protein kinase-like n=1 Tax=Crassostrea virginica TaxID=6565 RepID=A0A8B8C2F0_CRAVI|nr:striated muscle-specific serine/threonine-protein kinase-like [Crassostrea virginica]